METILKVEDLRVEYRSRESDGGVKLAVDGLNLEVGRGEVFGFLGPNEIGRAHV